MQGIVADLGSVWDLGYLGITAALGDIAAAAEHLGRTWSRIGDHAEPVLLLNMRDQPAFQAFASPRG